MRKKQRLQTSLFDHYVEHEIGNELKNISMILDQHIEVLDWVEKDIQTNQAIFEWTPFTKAIRMV